MVDAVIWSLILTGVGITSLYLVGKKNILGWVIGTGLQGLWFLYALYTEQYGFFLSVAVYGWVNVKSYLEWRKDDTYVGRSSV